MITPLWISHMNKWQKIYTVTLLAIFTLKGCENLPSIVAIIYYVLCTMVSNCYNPPEISSLDVISRKFPCRVLHIQIRFRFRSFLALNNQNLSNRCRHKYDSSISRIFQSNYWRVFDVWHNCVAAAWCLSQ